MSEDDLKKLPVFKSDEEAEKFVATADLSEYDLSDFKPVRFAFKGIVGGHEEAASAAGAGRREDTP